MRTGENEQGLKQVIDLTRGIAIVILLIHCYAVCYEAFKAWGLISKITDRLLSNLIRLPYFSGFMKAKLIALGFLLLSLIGVSGKKNEKIKTKTALIYFATGIILYLISSAVLYFFRADIKVISSVYISLIGQVFYNDYCRF